MSAMAGVTNPNMIKGIKNERNPLKMLLNVAKARTSVKGKIFPNAMPSVIAMMMRSNKGVLFFIIVIDALIKFLFYVIIV